MTDPADADTVPPPKRTLEQLVEALSPMKADAMIPEIEIRVIEVQIIDHQLPSGDMGKGVEVKFRAMVADLAWEDYDEDEKPDSVMGSLVLSGDGIFDENMDAEGIRQQVAQIIIERASIDIMDLAAEPHR